VSPRVRAALRFLEILTLRPDDLGLADLDEARAAGLDDAAIRDAALVCALFSTITRLADTLDFAIPASFDTTVKAVTSRMGYRLPPPALLLPRV
jgi:alkylhydroperoxidase family enzyme